MTIFSFDGSEVRGDGHGRLGQGQGHVLDNGMIFSGNPGKLRPKDGRRHPPQPFHRIQTQKPREVKGLAG